jgi:glycosyltransferase involved in cell wall biosynthesis
MKLFTAMGPGNIVEAHRARLAGKDISETSIAFSEQLLDYCKAANIETLGISSHPNVDHFRSGAITLENLPKPLWASRGALFHLGAVYYAARLALRARRFGADLALIDSGTSHYFALTAFKLFGIPVAVNLHNVLWPAGYEPQSALPSTIRKLNAWFFRNVAVGAVGVSPECERQVSSESNGSVPFFQYRCQFSPEGFAQSKPYAGGPFNIVFAGRIEQNKGVLDLAGMAIRLRALSNVPVMFHVCGNGPAIEALKAQIEADRLYGEIKVHGRLERPALLQIYANAHAAIIPTRSDFTEGMPQVAAEAILSGLPLITNKVTNTAGVLDGATLQAETDDSESYVEQILILIRDQDVYLRLRASCDRHAGQFLDRSQGYGAAVARLLKGYGTPV